MKLFGFHSNSELNSEPSNSFLPQRYFRHFWYSRKNVITFDNYNNYNNIFFVLVLITFLYCSSNNLLSYYSIFSPTVREKTKFQLVFTIGATFLKENSMPIASFVDFSLISVFIRLNIELKTRITPRAKDSLIKNKSKRFSRRSFFRLVFSAFRKSYIL